MIIVKDIPDIIKVNVNSYSSPCLILPRDEKKYTPEQLKEMKNTAVSGVVIKGINPWGNAEIYDPRGFSCCITNFDELLKSVDISRGVIQEDLWYGIKNSKDGSWMLLTAEMKSQTKKAIKSVNDLKPGFVYEVYTEKLVYLGRMKWKDDYGILRPHHTFANPVTREITYKFWLKGSEFKELGYDAPDVYEEARNMLLNSYQGSNIIQISKISIIPDLKYIVYDHSLLMPESFKELPMFRSDERNVVFIKQVDEKNISIIKFTSSAYHTTRRTHYNYKTYEREEEEIIDYRMTINNVKVQLLSKRIEISNHYEYLNKIDFNLSDFQFLDNIIKDPGYKCLDLSNKENIVSVNNILCFNKYNIDILNCTLSNGETKRYSDIINSIKF